MEIYRTIPQQIAAHLRQEILTGKLKPGDPLREIEVSERFGVSRGPIREAFRKLTQQGLLVLEPNKGVHVAPTPNASVRPLIVDLRRTIETFVLESSFDRITDDIFASLESILGDIKEACEKEDTSALVEHDLRFHKAIVESHEDTEIFEIWEPIMIRMMMHYDRLTNLMDSYLEHKAIVDAIRESDKTKATQAIRNNIQ
jgi:GntR family transcriptional regulator, rspAB operon transcriptional repressor